MDIDSKVMESVRNFLNIGKTEEVFDGEIYPHVLSSIGKLAQNGVVKSQALTNDTTWRDIIRSDMVDNEDVFVLLPLYVMLSVKMLFDPPPPSTLGYYESNLTDNLWRLRLIHDTKEVT